MFLMVFVFFRRYWPLVSQRKWLKLPIFRIETKPQITRENSMRHSFTSNQGNNFVRKKPSHKRESVFLSESKRSVRAFFWQKIAYFAKIAQSAFVAPYLSRCREKAVYKRIGMASWSINDYWPISLFGLANKASGFRPQKRGRKRLNPPERGAVEDGEITQTA